MKVKDILTEDRYHDQWAKNKAAENRARAKELKAAEKAAAARWPQQVVAPKVDLWKVWNALETVVSNVVPDGDPIDTLGPKLRRMGVDEYKIVDTLDAAVKKHYDKKSDYHGYLADMWDAYNDVAEPEYKRDNPWR